MNIRQLEDDAQTLFGYLIAEQNNGRTLFGYLIAEQKILNVTVRYIRVDSLLYDTMPVTTTIFVQYGITAAIFEYKYSTGRYHYTFVI